MKLPLLAVATILLTTSSLAFAESKSEYGYQSTSPQADQPYKAPEHKAGKAKDDEAMTGKDHKAGANHKAGSDHKAGVKRGYPPHVRYHRGYGHGYWRHGRFIPYRHHW